MEDKKIDDIIDMLDNFTLNGGGHMNVAQDESDTDVKKVETTISNCCNANMACMVPTLHEGIDE